MNIFEAFDEMNDGYIVRDKTNCWYKNDNGKLVESYNNGESWDETLEFEFGKINSLSWQLVLALK